MPNDLRSKVIRLAHEKPELRSSLLPLLKEAQHVEDPSLYGSPGDQRGLYVQNILVDELRKTPGFKVKTSPGGKLTLTVGSLNPGVKSIEFTGLDKDRAPFKMYLKNGLSGWGWDTARHVFYDDKNELRLNIVFDGKRDPEQELRAFVKNIILIGVKRALTTLNGQVPASTNPAKTQDKDIIQAKLLQIVKSVAKDALAFKASVGDSGPAISIQTYPDRPRLEFNFGYQGGVGGWGWSLAWNAEKQQVYLSSSNPQHHVDGGTYPIGKVKAELQRRLDMDKQNYLRVVEEQRKKSQVPEELSDQVWSVVTLGRDHGYATEVDTFDSKSAAEKAARDLGNVYVVKGTQMWNEPLGQVEEHDRVAPSSFFR